MLDQTLPNVNMCLMISRNYIQQLHNRTSMLQWIIGRFDFSQNEFEMRLAETNRIEEELLKTNVLIYSYLLHLDIYAPHTGPPQVFMGCPCVKVC